MFTKYENGAEVEITEVYRYDKSLDAEVEAEAVYKYDANIGAEVEVWSNTKSMYSYWKSDLYDWDVDVSENNGVTYSKYTMYKGTASSADYLYILVDGEFENPTISFDFFGGLYNGYGYRNGGSITAVGITASGTETRSTPSQAVGESGDFSGGSVTATLSGTFKSVGIRFAMVAVSGNDSAYTELQLSNIVIDDKKYIAG